MGKYHPRRGLSAFLIALAAVLALVAPVYPATSAAAPADPLAAASQVEPAVARIDTVIDYQDAIGVGTGIVLDPGGQVLTNFHVVQGADRITRPSADGLSGRSRRLRPQTRHRRAATARRGRAADRTDRRLGDSSAVGDPVVALGQRAGQRRPADP